MTELKQLLDLSPCLSIAYELKEKLRDIYEKSKTVKMGMRELTKGLTSAQVLFGQTAETIERHLPEICHYFINGTTSGVMGGGRLTQ
jgi:transposase